MNIKKAVEYCKTHNARIHTPTEETYDKLMEYLEEQGYRWISQRKPTTVDHFNLDDVFKVEDGYIYRGPLEFAKDCWCEVIEITEDTFTEKLEKFLAGDIVFRVDSWELCEELAKVFDAKGLVGCSKDRMPLKVFEDAWSIFKGDFWYIGYYTCLFYGDIGVRKGITEVTLKEVQDYLKLPKAIGKLFRPQKVTVRTPEVTLEFQANVTQTTDGLLIEQLVEPKFSVGDKVYTATAKVGTVVSVGKHPSDSFKVVYGITWVNGKSATGILEGHLTKLEDVL
jgi:hypothetical protein